MDLVTFTKDILKIFYFYFLLFIYLFIYFLIVRLIRFSESPVPKNEYSNWETNKSEMKSPTKVIEIMEHIIQFYENLYPF